MANTLQEARLRLKRELDQIESAIRAERDSVERARTDALAKEGYPEPYWSDDYAGVAGGGAGFYFGYEETWCPKHGTDCTCDDREWAFCAMFDGGKVTIPKSKLNVKDGSPMTMYVLAGIGALLTQGKLTIDPLKADVPGAPVEGERG